MGSFMGVVTQMLEFLQQVVPSLPELQVLRDAARALDELFLVVVRNSISHLFVLSETFRGDFIDGVPH
jgi:hypothetical protein